MGRLRSLSTFFPVTRLKSKLSKVLGPSVGGGWCGAGNHCGTLPLFQEIVKYLCHGEGFSIGHVVLLYQHWPNSWVEKPYFVSSRGGMGHRFKQRVSHPRRPPW